MAFRLEQLHEELDRVRQARAEAQKLPQQEKEILAQIDELQGKLGKKRLPLLDLAYVASPCPADWNEMEGDDRTRHCKECQKNVHNLSAMTQDEAERFLQELQGAACVRLYLRKDGSIITADCPVGIKRKKRKRIAGTFVGAGMATAGILTAQAENEKSAEVQPFELAVETMVSRAKRIPPITMTNGMLIVPRPWTPEMTKPTLVTGPVLPKNPSGITGTILARCTITAKGTLENCQIILGPRELRQATLEMLQQQKYTPVLQDGRPVEVVYTLKFKLEKN